LVVLRVSLMEVGGGLPYGLGLGPRAVGQGERTIEERRDVVGEQQRTQQPNEDDHELEGPEDESLVEKAKDKLADLVEEPEGADYDESKTNPVTGQPRR
jgi:hypothetical protein